MQICGIVAEYNPFHNGHAYQIQKTREILGENTAIVCAMSGNYVQRGEFAMLEKYRRAQGAVLGGADLILELPLAAALSSADAFAIGAVQLLLQAGCNALSFGCETPDLPLLCRTASLLDTLSFQPQAGRSYAATMQDCLGEKDAQAAALLSSPNNTLAISYLRAAKGHFATLVPIFRQGAAHDSKQTCDGFASGHNLRTLFASEQITQLQHYMPKESFALLMQAHATGALPTHHIDDILLAQLRALQFAGLISSDATGGFSERLFSAIYRCTSYSDIIDAAKSKHYPAARVRRALMREVVRLPTQASMHPQYIRVLALSMHGRELLRRMQHKHTLPIIIKPSTEKQLPQNLQESLRRDAYADDLYHLAMQNPAMRCGGQHYLKTPYVHHT